MSDAKLLTLNGANSCAVISDQCKQVEIMLVR